MRAVIATLAFASLAACTNFEPPTVVDSLRVLGLKSVPAEVASGQAATISALVVDETPPSDAGMLTHVITYDWALCNLVADTGQDINDDCFDEDMGTGITQLPTMADGSSVFTMPKHTLTDLGQPDSTGGLYVPVRLRVTSGATTITAFQKVRWANGLQPPNQNPTMAGISYVPTATDGELPDMGQVVVAMPLPDNPLPQPDATLALGGKLRFRALDTPGSAETYTTVAIDPTHPQNIMTTTVTELIEFDWYTTAGKFNNETTGEAEPDSVLDTTKYTTSIAPDDGLVDLWVVAHDERGGSDWIHRRVLLTQP